MLEALYTGSSTWITSSALTPYVTSSTLTTTLGNYVLSTTLSNYVTTSSLTTTLGSYMLKTGGTFTGNVTMSGAILDLGTNSFKFTNTSSVVRTMSQYILEALYNGATSWITAAQIPTSYLQRGTALTPVSFNSGRELLLDCTATDTCGIQFRSKDATTTNLTDSSIVSTGGGTSNYGGAPTLTASSINCKGTLYGWDSTAVAYMDVVGKINYIITNLQQTNTLLNNTIDAEDALALQVFKQTAGQGIGWRVWCDCFPGILHLQWSQAKSGE